MKIVSLGYTCLCGERVEVVRLKQDQPYWVTGSISISCSKGHNATFSRAQIGYLEVLTAEAAMLRLAVPDANVQKQRSYYPCSNSRFRSARSDADEFCSSAAIGTGARPIGLAQSTWQVHDAFPLSPVTVRHQRNP